MATTVIQRASMKIDVDETAKVLERVGATARCPYAGNDTEHRGWGLADEFVAIVPYNDARGIILHQSYPAVMLACETCGHMALFSAIKLGLISLDEGHVNG